MCFSLPVIACSFPIRFFNAKIRDETGTRIDLPDGESDSNIIKITGHKAQCEEARERILAIQNELVSD